MSARHLHPAVLRSSRGATLLRLLLAASIALGPVAPAQAAYGTSGRWSDTRYTRDIAIHLALLPGDASWHSRILFWGLFNTAADSLGGALWRWNPPTTHTPCAGGVDTTQVVFIDFANDPSFDPFCSGHSVLADGRLLVAGGHIAEDIGPEETSLFDPATRTWSDPILMDAGRWYPSLVSLPTSGEAMIFAGSQQVSVLHFGGQWDTVGAHRDTLLNICLLDDGSAWTQAIIAQQHASPWRPGVRTGHTLTGNHPVGATALFGGRDSVGNPKNDLWYLRADVKDHGIDYRWEYRTPDNQSGVTERSGHSAAVDSLGRMHVFGGLDEDGLVISELRRWRPRQSQSESAYGVWEAIGASGSAPPARQGHAAIVDTIGGRDRMLLFGGVDASGVPVDTKVWALTMNAATPAWSEITVSGGPGRPPGAHPAPRTDLVRPRDDRPRTTGHPVRRPGRQRLQERPLGALDRRRHRRPELEPGLERSAHRAGVPHRRLRQDLEAHDRDRRPDRGDVLERLDLGARRAEQRHARALERAREEPRSRLGRPSVDRRPPHPQPHPGEVHRQR